jgi:hypothetical protein
MSNQIQNSNIVIQGFSLDPNPDLETELFSPSVIASTCKVRGNLIEKCEIASVPSQ